VQSLGEEAFRGLLDARGLLREGAMAEPSPRLCFAVFSQRAGATLDAAALEQNAARFFTTRLGLSVDKDYGPSAPAVDAAHVVVAGASATTSGTRLCYGRAVEPADVDAAGAAERRQGTYGLALLAQRCPTLWLVVPTGDDDRTALTIAAIFASVMLGPILSPDGPTGAPRIFGVRTARLELEAPPRPYR